MHRGRKGVTLIEMLAVFAIIGILAAFGLPKFSGVTERAKVSAARDQVLAALNLARATAVRRAATATFYATGNDIKVTADSSGTEVTILKSMSLSDMNGVTVSTTGNTSKIAYNMRGLSSGASGKIRVTRGTRSDSVCVTALGAAMKQGCL